MKQSAKERAASRIFYVYAYLDTTKPGYYRFGRWVFHYEPFYIGYGQGDRAYVHLKIVRSGAIDKHNPHKSYRIRKILRESKGPPKIRFMKKNLYLQEAKDLETTLISLIGRRNLKSGPLTNRTDGGEGTTGQKHSRKSIQKIKSTKETFSEEKKLAIKEKIANTKASKSPKEKRSTAKKQSEARTNYLATASPRKLSRISKKAAVTRANRPQEEKDLDAEKRRTKLENKTPRQKKATAKKRSESLKISHAKKTPRQRKALNKRLSESARIEREARGSEARKEAAVKMVETRMSRPKKVKDGIIAKFKKSRWGKPEKELKAISKKTGNSIRNRTPEQKAASEEKRHATIARHLAEDPDYYIKIRAKGQHTIDSKSDEEKEALRIRQSENQKKVWKKLTTNQIQEITSKCHQTKKDLGYY